MKKAEKKEVEVKAELNPLSKEQFEDLYNKAWENGWVYGKFFQELYDEYLVNWRYFIVYLDNLKITKHKNIEILIGEAPPYWKGNANNEDKSYFYNPEQTNSSKWLNAPADWKSVGNKFKTNAKTKDLKIIKNEKLTFLAKKGLILFDIFPFPIIQDTKIRQAVSGKFPEHIEHYFIPKLNSIIKYVDVHKRDIKYGFVATTYGSLHLLFGDKTRELFLKKFDLCFYNNGIVIEGALALRNFVFQLSLPTDMNEIRAFKERKPTALFKYIYKLICPANLNPDVLLKKIVGEELFNNDHFVIKINRILEENTIPILMDGSGNVNFTKFFNFKNLTKTFEDNKQ